MISWSLSVHVHDAYMYHHSMYVLKWAYMTNWSVRQEKRPTYTYITYMWFKYVNYVYVIKWHLHESSLEIDTYDEMRIQ